MLLINDPNHLINSYSHHTVYFHRAVAIRFGVIRLVVCAQERYTLGRPGGMLPQENFEI